MSTASAARAGTRAAAPGRVVAILGVSPQMRGGIAAVLQSYRRCGLDQRVPVAWIATAGEGPTAARAAVFVRGLARFLALALRGRVAVAHLMVASGGSFWRKSLLVRLCRLLGVPSLLHVHGGLFDRFYDESSPWIQRYIRRTLEHSTHVIALGERWQRLLQAIAPRASVLTIPNGVVLPAAGPAAIGNRGGRDTLLFLGRLEARKGIFELLQAFALFAPRCPQVQLVCGGDGDERPVRAAIARLPDTVRSRIVLAGWIEAGEQPAWFRRSIALVLPSRGENLPMSALEAHAHGVPVIATPVGSVQEAVIDRRTGLIVPVDDVAALAAAMVSITQDDAQWVRMSVAARAHIEAHFAAASVVARIESLYREHLAQACGAQRSRP
jgi:glycosyltransferase involved in cell wall biosynthesis